MPQKFLSLFPKLMLIPAAFLLFFSVDTYVQNLHFTEYACEMFEQEITANTLNLHYTLTDPASLGIPDTLPTFGDASPDSLRQGINTLKTYQLELQKISRSRLSSSNQLTYDILDAYFTTQMKGADFLLYPEPLGPTIGTQAQLPVLLAEYAFRSPDDVEEYLALLSQTDTYYDSLLTYEQEKSKAGLFMSDTTLDAVLSQCQAFLDSKGAFMRPVFAEKLQNLSTLSDAEQNQLIIRHEEILEAHVLPAYQLLITGLESLRGTGQNAGGLVYLEKGREYYEYLVADSTGSSLTVPALQKRIMKQLQTDFSELQKLVTANPDVLRTEASSTIQTDPMQILAELKEKMLKDFPAAPEVSFQVKYVHESLEDYLSPAFYLTPPLDDLTQNTIYINPSNHYTDLELYTTLAHEGYPGHLYQTVYSGSTSPSRVRSLLNFGGYVEGWATYVEFYSYDLADTAPALSSLYRLNRSITLGLSSLMDIAIHYYGYTRTQTAAYLSEIGFQDSSMADSLYDAILEAPANYLKYYAGYLSFLDLRNACQEKRGSDFSLKDFHQEVLEIGPAPFSVLESYLLKE